MTNLIAHLVDAIERAHTARRSDFTLTPQAIAFFPTDPPPDTRCNLSFLSPSSPDVVRPGLVARPQDCNCGASQVAMVAHWERCVSRLRGGE